MAYWFSGIFADGDQQVMSAVLSQVSGTGRLIEEPFRGFGVQLESQEDVDDLRCSRDFQLVPWSRAFPSVTFVYLHVECFGGDCCHSGFAFRDGQVLQEIEFDGEESDVPLRELLKHLGVNLGESVYFAPLEREYFKQRKAGHECG